MLSKIIIALTLLTLSISAYANNPQVRIITNQGSIEIELNSEKAPKTVKNFLQYVKSDHYAGTVFHRVIRNFMIQGGGFSSSFVRKETSQPIANEADNGLKNVKGSIAMARTNAPHSATDQFFINTADNGFLNHKNKTMRGWGYTVFGKVTKGLEVVDIINNTRTGAKAMFPSDAPQQNIVIHKIELINE